jgi:predicted amidohydrolase YtcJ
MQGRERIFANGAVFSGQRVQPWVQTVAVRGHDILQLGSLDELRRASPARSRRT